jgi:DNA-binding transcriptional LysR family regulator
VDAGELHVGTLFSISVGVLPKALRSWRQNYPDVQVRLVEFRRTQDLIAAMEAGRADLAACKAAGFEPHAAVRTEQAPSALTFALEGLGLTLIPGNVIPPEFPGRVLWPEPPVNRELSVYTRVRPDPITAAFVAAITRDTLATPPHLLKGRAG